MTNENKAEEKLDSQTLKNKSKDELERIKLTKEIIDFDEEKV